MSSKTHLAVVEHGAGPGVAEQRGADGRLAAAGLADQADHLAGPEDEVDVVDDVDPGRAVRPIRRSSIAIPLVVRVVVGSWAGALMSVVPSSLGELGDAVGHQVGADA